MTDTISAKLVERQTAFRLGWRQQALQYLQSLRKNRRDQVSLAKERDERCAVARHAQTLDNARGRVQRFWRHSI